MKEFKFIFVVLCMAIIAGSCGTTDSDSNGDDQPQQPTTPSFTLSANVSPDESGTVTPSSGTFDEGSQVTVEANPNEGWSFDGWTGDIESNDNPLTFTISSNTSLTANFVEVSSIYLANMTAANSGDEIELVFGQQSQASSVEAPPAPPAGAFHAWFERDGSDLFTDVVSSSLTEVTWRLNLQAGNDNVISLSWIISNDDADGTLTLTDQAGNFELDMFAEDNYQVNADDVEFLLIEYLLELD